MEETKERWRAVVDYEGLYEISDFGRVRSAIDRKNTFKGKILKQETGVWGYKRVRLYKNGKSQAIKVHKIVITAFIGRRPDGKEVNHKDGDKTNNWLDNLEYVTPSENIRHAYRTGLASQRGEKNANSKLTEDDVHEIRRLLLKGMTQKTIAAMFNVSQQRISSINVGDSWAYLKEEEDDERT